MNRHPEAKRNFHIDSPIEQNFRLNPRQRKALKKLGLTTLRDLVYHFPTRYGDTAQATYIANLSQGSHATVYGKINKLKTGKGFRTKISMATAILSDESGTIELVWFNQPYIAKMIAEDSLVRVEGKVSARRKKTANKKTSGQASDQINEPANGQETKPGPLYFSNPKIEIVNKVPIGVGDSLFKQTGNTTNTDTKNNDGENSNLEAAAHHLYPIYPESSGLTSNWIYHALEKIFKSGALDEIVDPIPAHILSKYNLPSQKTALIWIHMPMSHDDATAARKRMAFEEVFFIQITKQKARLEYAAHRSFIIDPKPEMLENFVKRLPFTLSTAQMRATETILNDMRNGQSMSRLLEGDVGSGKTAVAAITTFAAITTKPGTSNKKVEANSTQIGAVSSASSLSKISTLSKTAPRGPGMLQVAYMCPTEILATQHFESFIQYFAYLGISIGLMTGSGCRKFPSKVNPKGWTPISRSQLLKWVENGEIPILIGTHALIQKSVKFKNLGYVIIDEQHRFGTAQRAKLVRKDDIAPHLLSMTATPIPRTLALTIYGDLDISLLDEMPPGRKIPITKIAQTTEELSREAARNQIYEEVRRELSAGRQAYVICPRIDEPDPDKEATLNARSVKEEAKRLKREVFKEYEIGILHSKMKPAEKDKVMQSFKSGKIHILCSTSVVEVGVNVPNANVIIIEGSERFGLAQLHQLRGRVIRGTHQPYCYLFAESMSETTTERLHAFTSAKNGFELAEYDLQLRGSGMLYSGKQWGVSDLAMEALKNLKMVEAARTEASLLLNQDPNLKTHPLIQEHIKRGQNEELHFE